MKTLVFTPPIKGQAGPYTQMAVLLDGDAKSISTFPASTVPNPFVPRHKDRPNLEEYPIVRPGVYKAYFSVYGHHGHPGIVLNDNGPVPIIQDINPQTGVEGTADYIHVHEGYTDQWRGSAGCMTLGVGGNNWMIKNFDELEDMLVSIPDQDWFTKED